MYIEILKALLRHFLTVAGGAAVVSQTAGANTDVVSAVVDSVASGNPTSIAGSLVTVAGVAWSIYDKKKVAAA